MFSPDWFDLETKYTVIDGVGGAVARHLTTVHDIAVELLSEDGGDWQVCTHDGGWRLWCKSRNDKWRGTMLFSFETTQVDATADLLSQYVDNCGEQVWTDEEYDKWME